ncbi:MAG: hypothetical protein RLZZ555_572 [Pseudomonadota bacterium]|jgi:filamentous hemagglutinin family protein
MRTYRRPAPGSAKRSQPLTAPRQLPLALAIVFASLHGMTQAQLPTGARVASGSASWMAEGGAMAVRNSPNAIIEWQSFSIGPGNQVHFDQQESGSQVLNRVVGQDASLVLGRLSSNGRVWLINPNGILFGPGARVDVTGLVASTLNLSNAAFLDRKGMASSDAGKPGAAIVNQGVIFAAPGGTVWLIGSSVRNEGLIQAPGGQILLAAGRSLEFVDAAAPNLVLRVSAPENEAVNLGSLLASGPNASIGMLAGIVNQQGLVRADSTGTDSAGRVVLSAQGDLLLAAASQTSASAPGSGSGGQVVAESNAGTTLVSGQVTATSSQGQGGSVRLLGQRVGAQGQALVDASGASAGGEVMLGADYQGGHTLVGSARASYVGPDVKLRADATGQGDGGRVIVWSDQATRVHGSLSARGGPVGGNGGLIETSGAYLDARPAEVDASAPAGRPGIWLLDPNDIRIAAYEENLNIETGTPVWTTTDDSGSVNSQVLANVISQGQQVVIRTGSAGSNSQLGDITVAGSVVVQCGSTSACPPPGSLTLQAHRDIIVEPDVQITTQSGAMPLSLLADGGSIRIQTGARLDSGAGTIALQAGQAISLDAGAVLSSTAGGDSIVLSSGSFDNQAGSLALSAPNGRWLIQTDRVASTQPGGLAYDFVQFGVGASTVPAQASGNGLLHAEALDLQGRISRVYDGTASAILDASTAFSGAPAGYQVNLAGPGTGSFADKNVGADKPVMLVTIPVLEVKDAASKPVYGHSASYSGSITQAPLTIAAAASTKVYDGSASSAAFPVVAGLRPGDEVTQLSQAYVDGNAGTGKELAVLTGYQINDGNGGGNYQVTLSGNKLGVITQAPLTFTAHPAQGHVAQPLPALSGTVTGFIAGEQLPDSWLTSAVPSSGPGRYEIRGSVPADLSANYSHIQAAGNEMALTLLADDSPTASAQQALRDSDAAKTAAQRLAQPPVDALAATGLLDLSALAPGQLFSSVRIGGMSQADLAGLLETRREFKRKLFADSISRLQIDPSLADVQPCGSAEEAGSGNCRITAEQVSRVQADRHGKAVAPRQAALPQIQRKIAVLFGINDYGDPRIPRLESAIPDVDAVARVLSASMGYETRVLRNPGKADIVRTLNQLSTELTPRDSALVYYAGHGYSLERQGSGYWIAADSPADEPRRWLSNHDIARLLAAYPARQLALVSDSCYSGAFAREAIEGAALQPDAGEVLGKRSVVVLTSGGDEPVTDEGKQGHSIFAWNLMQSLAGVQGWTAGHSVFRQVQSGVRREFPQTPHYGAVTEAGHQRGGEYLFEVR